MLEPPQKLGYNEKYWDGTMVCRYLKEKWNIEIAVRTAQNWIIKINMRKVARKRIKYPITWSLFKFYVSIKEAISYSEIFFRACTNLKLDKPCENIKQN